MAKSLTNITDDLRINVRAEAYDYIKEALKYYKGDFPNVKYMPSTDYCDALKSTFLAVFCNRCATITIF